MRAGTADRAPLRAPGGWRRTVAAPAGIFLAGQALAVAVLAAMSAAYGKNLLDRLHAWDGNHFLAIAEHGYTFSPAPDTVASPAFLPGYPAAIALVHAATGLAPLAAALVISWVSGAVFACAIPRLVRRIPRAGRRAELVSVALVAASPLSVVFSMAYSEALFCALAAWSLVAALDRRWWLAAVLAFPAGLTRVSGLALAAAFGVEGLVLLATGRGGRRFAAAARAVGAGLAAAVGTIGWIVWAGVRMGSPGAWFTAQRTGWHSGVDWGRATVDYVTGTLGGALDPMRVVTSAVIVIACALAICAALQRQPLLLVVYGWAAVAEVVLSSGIMNSRVRLMIPAFVILFPVACWLARRPRPVVIAGLVAVAAVGMWFGGWGLTVWRYAI